MSEDMVLVLVVLAAATSAVLLVLQHQLGIDVILLGIDITRAPEERLLESLDRRGVILLLKPDELRGTFHLYQLEVRGRDPALTAVRELDVPPASDFIKDTDLGPFVKHEQVLCRLRSRSTLDR